MMALGTVKYANSNLLLMIAPIIILVTLYVLQVPTVTVDMHLYEIVKYLLITLLTFICGLGVKEIINLRRSVDSLRIETVELKVAMNANKSEIGSINRRIDNVSDQVSGIAEDLHEIRGELKGVKEDVTNLKKRRT
jgi:hypothetical protein